MSTRRKAYAEFKSEFETLCKDWGGVLSEKWSITPESPAFLFETNLGTLQVSIHDPIDYRREEILPGSIYMRFHTYTGPVGGPGGDFNRYSWKWNIHCQCDDAYSSRQRALLELYHRLRKLMAKPEERTADGDTTYGQENNQPSNQG